MHITDTRLSVGEITYRWSHEQHLLDRLDVQNMLWLEFWIGSLPLFFGHLGVYRQVRREEVLSAIGNEVDLQHVHEDDLWRYRTFFDYSSTEREAWLPAKFVSKEWAQDRYVASSHNAFQELYVERTHLRGVCALRDWKLPTFWYSMPEREAFDGDPGRREAKLVFWLHAQVFSDPANLGRKADVLDYARRLFRIPDKTFDRVWKEEAPPEFRKSGRPSKPSRPLPDLKPNWLK